MAVLTKENEILKRRLDLQNKKVIFETADKIIFAIISSLTKTKELFIIVKPETVLKWYKSLLRKRWTFPNTNKRVRRPPIPSKVKQLILEIKNNNILWGNKRISDELKKIDTDVSTESVRKIISVFRKKGKVKKSLTWSKFLESHWNSLFAIDSFTVDSLLGKTFMC